MKIDRFMISSDALLTLFAEAACSVIRFYACESRVLFVELAHENGSCVFVNVQQYSLAPLPAPLDGIHVTRVTSSLSAEEQFLAEHLGRLERPPDVLGWIARRGLSLFYLDRVYVLPVRESGLLIDTVLDIEYMVRSRKSIGTDVLCLGRWFRDRLSASADSSIGLPFLAHRAALLVEASEAAHREWEKARRVLELLGGLEDRLRNELRELDAEESTTYEFSRSVYNLSRRRRLEKAASTLSAVLGPRVRTHARDAGRRARSALFFAWLFGTRATHITAMIVSLLNFVVQTAKT